MSVAPRPTQILVAGPRPNIDQISSMVRTKRIRVSASKSRLTSIRRPLASNISRTLLSVLPLRRLRVIFTSTRRTDFPCPCASVRRLFSPRCDVLSAKPWLLQNSTKLHVSQSARREFRNPASDLLAAAPLLNLNLFAVIMPTADQNRASLTRWVGLTDTLLCKFRR
jgi:hypothetical protein